MSLCARESGFRAAAVEDLPVADDNAVGALIRRSSSSVSTVGGLISKRTVRLVTMLVTIK